MTLRPLLLLALALPLAGCLGDKSSEPAPAGAPLNAVEVRDASGALTTLTLLDRDAAGSLVRVRYYTGAGPDGTWRTDDDEVYSWSRCRVDTGTPALMDPLLELGGRPWVGDRFAVPNCAIEERASRIWQRRFSQPGADGRWFTDDDVAEPTLLLQRTSGGHRLTVTPPATAATSCELNCEGLNNIVYDPYAGLETETETTATYTQDDGVDQLLQGGATFRYVLDEQGRLVWKRATATPGTAPDTGNMVLDLFTLGATQTSDSFDYWDDGTIRVTHMALVEEEIFASIEASPTGQILLALLGYNGATVTQGGITYREIPLGRYRLLKQDGRPQQVIQVTGPGPDNAWNSEDDELGRRLVYLYDTP